MGKWTTIVGDHAPKPPTLGPDRVEVRYVLDSTTNSGDATAPISAEQRARLLYERGEGPQAPDLKPEPTPKPRDRRTHRAERPATAWTGYTRDT